MPMLITSGQFGAAATAVLLVLPQSFRKASGGLLKACPRATWDVRDIGQQGRLDGWPYDYREGKSTNSDKADALLERDPRKGR